MSATTPPTTDPQLSILAVLRDAAVRAVDITDLHMDRTPGTVCAAVFGLVKPIADLDRLRHEAGLPRYDWGDPAANQIEILFEAETDLVQRHEREFRMFVKEHPEAGEVYLNCMHHWIGGEFANAEAEQNRERKRRSVRSRLICAERDRDMYLDNAHFRRTLNLETAVTANVRKARRKHHLAIRLRREYRQLGGVL